MKTTEKTWQVVGDNLLKNKSGHYYGRFNVSGKSKWFALKTNKRVVADIRLAEKRLEVERERQAGANVGNGTCRMAELITLYCAQVNSAPAADLSARTRTRYLELAEVLRKTWPDMLTRAPNWINRPRVVEWRDRIAKDGTGFIAPGAKARSANNDGTAPTTINKTIDVLRRCLEIAVERGQLVNNPLAGRGIKLRDTPRKPVMPDAKTLTAIFSHIESQGGLGEEIANFCRFLAFTGCRLNEANSATWQDIDFTRGLIRIHGTKTDAADREVPLIPEARALLEKVKQRRAAQTEQAGADAVGFTPKGRIFLVAEATRSLTNACMALKTPRLTHHDLRDAFATTCIESGVDIPTIAAWLGHADGGALLMKTYAHHRRAHSLAQAAKVSFGGQSHA